jgi:hypothetical protein
MEQTECSETSAYKIQTPGNYPEENIQQKQDSFPQSVSTASEAHPPPIPWLLEDISPSVERLVCENDQAPPPSGEVNNLRSYIHTPPPISWRSA